MATTGVTDLADEQIILKFAQKLAGNEKKFRDRAVKKLRKWLEVRSRTGKDAFGEMDLMKIWKGLYYCMWMSDKPLVQEELSDTLGKLIHCFATYDQSILFVNCFLQTMAREWFGIDKLRLDKFMMLVRTYLRETFVAIQNQGWKKKKIKKFTDMYGGGAASAENDKFPMGLKFHLADMYLEELTDVGAQVLSSDKVTLFLEPYMKMLPKCKSELVVQKIAKHIFREIEKRAVEYTKIQQVDEEYRNEDDHMELLQYDYTTLAESLFNLAKDTNCLQRNRQVMYGLVKRFKELASGNIPSQYDPSRETIEDGLSEQDIEAAVKKLVALDKKNANKKRKGATDDDGPSEPKKLKGIKVESEEEEYEENGESGEAEEMEQEPEVKGKKKKKKATESAFVQRAMKKAEKPKKGAKVKVEEVEEEATPGGSKKVIFDMKKNLSHTTTDDQLEDSDDSSEDEAEESAFNESHNNIDSEMSFDDTDTTFDSIFRLDDFNHTQILKENVAKTTANIPTEQPDPAEMALVGKLQHIRKKGFANSNKNQMKVIHDRGVVTVREEISEVALEVSPTVITTKHTVIASNQASNNQASGGNAVEDFNRAVAATVIDITPRRGTRMSQDGATVSGDDCMITRTEVQKPNPRVKYVKVHNIETNDLLQLKSFEWLSDIHINLAQALLKQQFPEMEGLENTGLSDARGNKSMFTAHDGEFVQLYNAEGNHWCAITNIGCVPHQVKVYDSLYRKASKDTLRAVKNLMNSAATITLTYPTFQKQKNDYDCGLYAIAAATCLCFGRDPSKMYYNVKTLRQHLEECFQFGKMIPFPLFSYTFKNNRLPERTVSMKLSKKNQGQV